MSDIENPQVRPGLVRSTEPLPRIVAFFANSAPGNAAIQQLQMLGVPSDRLGVTPPDRIPGGQGMILSVACPDSTLSARIEDLCRRLGAEIHRDRRPSSPVPVEPAQEPSS
jgi:hypothetical protein